MAAYVVASIDACDLPKEQFISSYLSRNLPVIVRRVEVHTERIDFQFLKSKYGDKDVVLHAKSGDYECKLSEYIEGFDEIRFTDDVPYLSDWSIPKFLPQLLSQLQIPDVWDNWRDHTWVDATDSGKSFGYFFIGPAGVTSPLHSGFVM
jgi:hypothetical protein